MRRTASIAAIAALALTGCSASNSSGPTSPQADAETAPVESSAASTQPTFPGGKVIDSYKGDPTYDWRVKLAEQQNYVARALQELPDDDALVPLDDSAFERIISVCTELASLKSNAEIVADVRRLWSKSATSLIREDTALEIFPLSVHWSCPSLGTRPAGVAR